MNPMNPYPPQQGSQQTPIIVKPRVWMLILSSVAKILGVALLIIGIVIYLNYEVGLDVFKVPLDTLGVSVNGSRILLFFILAVVGLSLLMALLNYLAVKGVRYELYPDKITLYRTIGFVLVKSRDIPYSQVSRVYSVKGGFFNSLFNTGNVAVEVSPSMRKEELEFIGDNEAVAATINNLVKQYGMQRQAAYSEQYRINNIVERY